jgi:hypothetical protein
MAGGGDKGSITMRRLVSRSFALSCISVLLLSVAPAFGLDAVRLAGTPDKLRLELNDATVGDALAALQSAFDMKCRCPPAMDRRVTGDFQGNIGRVLARLLEGNDYVIKTTPSGAVEVIIPGANAAAASAQAVPSPRYASSPAAVDAMSIGLSRVLQQQRQKK